MDPLTLSPGLAMWPEVTLTVVVVLLAAGLLRVALGRRTSALAILGGLVRSSLQALFVLGLLALFGSVAPLLPGMLALDPPTESMETAFPSVPAPSAGLPRYQSPFGSIADDIRLMPLERALPRAVTALPAGAPPHS